MAWAGTRRARRRAAPIVMELPAPTRRAARPGRGSLVRARRHRHLRPPRAGPQPAVPGEARLPGLVGPRLPQPGHRPGLRRPGAARLAGHPSRERAPARHAAAGDRRPHPRRAGPPHRLRHRLPPERHQAGAGRPAGPLDLRGHRAQLAPASPPVHVHADRLGHRAAPGRRRRGLVLGARADGAPEGHARGDPAPGLLGPGAGGAAHQPHAARADLPVVGQRGGARPRRLRGLLPAGRELRGRPRQARHVHLPRGPRALLRRRLRGAPGRAGRPALVPQHPGARRPTWPWAATATSSAATTTPPARASCTGPTTPSRRARSSGHGATMPSAMPGTAS